MKFKYKKKLKSFLFNSEISQELINELGKQIAIDVDTQIIKEMTLFYKESENEIQI